MTPHKVSIMQPTYLPWVGYFDLIAQSDYFVFLDSVQFNDRSWQQRNRIKGSDRVLWITVPVLTKGRREQTIKDVIIDKTQNFSDKHIKTISQFYGKAPFFSDYMEGIKSIFDRSHEHLVNLNIDLIGWICEHLGIKKELIRSSSLNVEGSKTELLVNICKCLGARHYLSAEGSRTYIEENNLFDKNGIELSYHSYNHPEYTQLYGDFIPHMSAIDLLLNEGPASLSIIRSGRA